MSKFSFVQRNGSKLVPVDKFSEQEIRTIPEGEITRITWSRPRNIEFHRKFFSLLRAGFQLQSNFSNFDVFRFWLILKTERVDIAISPNGETVIKPKDISFSAMDEDEFEALYSDVLDVILREFAVKREDVERVMEYA